MDNWPVQVAIDQLLFGYRDGHELLASSLKIDSRLEAELLPHADARFEDRSEHYLVGVPVTAMRRFMLTRIWPAPELPRPGAVWAHSLLVEEAALTLIDPLALLDLFRRPVEKSALDGYTTALSYKATGPRRVSAVPEQLMAALCDVAYARRGEAAVLIWPEEAEAETGVLALWRRLPLRERRSLSFRSRGRARTGASPYRIQLATQLGGRSATQKVRVLIPSELDPGAPIALLADASQDPTHPLGPMLDEFALNAADSLVIAGLWPLRSKDAPAIIDRLAELASDSLASNLARALFGPTGSDAAWWDLGEVGRIAALLAAEAPLARSLLAPPRLRAAWEHDHKTMLALLDERHSLPGESAQLLVESASDALALEELLARAADRELIARALNSRCDLLDQPELWSALEDSSDLELRERALRRAGPKAIPHLLETEAWGLLDQSLSDLEMLPTAVGLLAERSPTDAALWNQALAGHDSGVARLLTGKRELPEEAAVLAAAELPELDRVPARRWLAAAPSIHDRDDEVALIAAARLIAWSARRKRPNRELLVECFGPAHRAVESGRLPIRAKKELEQALPHPKMKSLGKRLSRALVEDMESSDWSQAELSRALEPAGPAARREIKHVPKKHPARRLIEGTLRDLEEILPLR